MSCCFAGGAAQKGNLDLKKGRESTREQPDQQGSGVSPHQKVSGARVSPPPFELLSPELAEPRAVRVLSRSDAALGSVAVMLA
ncbi:hypothetical protein KIL84_017386 [Mauremys mutica]|uniref:Uncharacterized protein n=1 Tax=Mauremys mutica TaxID=74926 RepID=A0A9D4ARL2_9SAUR|nr:hypothetical protein KIL84_017386 [Mauremys mutica]